MGASASNGRQPIVGWANKRQTSDGLVEGTTMAKPILLSLSTYTRNATTCVTVASKRCVDAPFIKRKNKSTK